MGWKAAADCLNGVEGSRILFLGSAWATVEDNYLLKRMADALGAPAPVYMPHSEDGHGDGWLRTDDRTPNAQGCERLGIHAASPLDIKARLDAGDVDVLYVMEDDPVASGVCSAADLAGVKVVLHHYNTTNQTLEAADVALPAAMAVETVGTFVNMDGHAQRLLSLIHI